MFKQLRQRLVAATFALMTGTACMMAGGVYLAFELVEDQLLDLHLAREIDNLMTIFNHSPELAALPNKSFQIYVAPNGNRNDLPDYLKTLELDVDDVFINGKEFDVAHRQRGATRYYFVHDESAVDEFENTLFQITAGVTLAVILLAAWLSHAITGRVIRPLTRLAGEVAELSDNVDGHVTIPTRAAAEDEVGRLARAISGYHDRVSRMLQREREFSSDVSHELRTPMMAIQGAAELLQRFNNDTAKSEQLINQIKRGCSHMATLTESLLFLAREPSSFSDMVEPVSIRHVVDSQITAVQDYATRKGVQMKIETRGNGATINTIPAVANIVIGNILKNAVKYTDKDEVRVFISEEQVVVQDYGPGMDLETQQSLFDRFSRGEHVMQDGAGIGLALVRRFCEQYGWEIDLDSQTDKGTRIAVVF